MKIFSANDYITAAANTRAYTNLNNLFLIFEAGGMPAMRSSSRFLELDAIWHGRPCRICCPFDPSAFRHAERLNAALKNIDSPLLATYRPLPKELQINNELCDIVLEVLPEGTPLNQILAQRIHSKQARQLASEWITTAENLSKIPFSHRALSTSRIIVRADGGMTLCGLHHGRVEDSTDDHRAIVEITYEILRKAFPNTPCPSIDELITASDRHALCDKLRSIAGVIKINCAKRPTENIHRITRQLLNSINFSDREWIGIVSEDRIAFREGDRYGYLDMFNKVVIKPQFISVEPFHEGRAVVTTDSGAGLINKQGEWVIAPEHDEINWSADYTIATVRNKNGWALYDLLGNRRSRYFDYLGDCSDRRIAASLDGRWGYIDTHGCEVIALRYDDAFEYKNGRARVVLNGRPFDININGLEIP
ncbi:MAG: WG repeat-containing protein [Rikenellaceae bacterium]|nr:WG repeat-containing protein [Rikenellaceae bacterium]